MDATDLQQKLLRLAHLKAALMGLMLITLGVILSIVFIVMFDVKDTAENIQSCTSPKGACYKDANARTGAAVDTINQISVYAAYCSRVPANDTVELVKSCIQEELEKNAKSKR